MGSSFQRAALAAVALVLACSDSPASSRSAAAGVGACCGDAATCPQSACGAGLHCGASQTPRPVGICCAEGSVCCILDADCQRDANGAVCDKATFTCACAGDDARCGAGYHCAGNACAAGLADGAACTRGRECASGNCSAPFDPAVATSTCAPAGTCAAGAASYPVGYVLCAAGAGASTSSRTCGSGGVWSAPATFSGKAACTTVSGYATGATCTSGPDAAVNGLRLACVDCGRYLPAATLDGCRSSCAKLLDCAPGSYCQGRTCVASLANGSPCLDDGGREVHAACQSGRCDGACMDKLASGARCGEDADCQAGLFCLPSQRDISGRVLETACSGGCRDASDCGPGYTECVNNACRT